MHLNTSICEVDNPDLTEEREKGTFDTDKMAAVIYGSEKLARRRREISEAVSKIPELADTQPFPFMDRLEKITEGSRKLEVLNNNIRDIIDYDDNGERLHIYQEVTGMEGHPLALHEVMFIPALVSQASKEQQEKWLGRARRREIIGCYAQTEMGHGTNLRKLETTATYFPDTQEFVLNTPTTTALKWWPGALGKSSNYAVVVVDMIIKGKSYGPHPFMVQLRDEKTHIPLKGIVVGDIGPKMSFNGGDNGFLGFDKFRVPRTNLLMRHVRVEADGTYVKPPHAKVNHSAMVHVRSHMATGQGALLAQALIIAVRYSAVRRQGFLENKTQEVKVLDYQTQQHRLFPSLARAYAFIFTGFETIHLYSQLLKDVDMGNTSGMADLHALTSGLKSVVTHQTGEGIEQARMACGGHGYSMASYISEIYGIAIGGCTYEGENMVMLLQLARYLVKSVELIKSGEAKKLGPMVSYLAAKGGHPDLSSLNGYVTAFEHMARRQAWKATEKFLKLMESGESREIAWNKSTVELTRASRLHTRLFIIEAFMRRVSRIEDIPVKEVLTDLLHLHVNYELLDVATYALEFMSSTQLDYIRDQLYLYLEKIRPSAVSLVDSFQISDMQLRSVLGRRDGNVYENLFKWAKSSPLNKSDVLPSVDKYLMPMMEKAKL
ncbi:Acyl-coenzyme A oxidase acox-1.4 [Caenorhabditis elegans]|uniref:Acyl-coenzyme A oxidase acox-1.4 n=1 Tax=Caenorhabditis elegans TaxID=6239 RepID=ACX14_CAEEL|nr:Acyl-coenzyme A oxidase acox-1.4 [Caenorhabditis elegans]O62139.1 RecName: Full=Acyl-coenzyme A oxidase acox-1.4 [Caenorhabditis elegans]CAB16866.1 Acyl-coenzyme A oxidase acox-1.4 [Caenorhabditis elegans]|eukprot:NP_493264.1 Acyl-coenzyme A oxidase [Caenorhabditis elegans]